MIRQLSSLKYENSKSLKLGRFPDWVANFTFSRVIKRLFDIVFSLLGLVILSPFFAYISHLVRRDSNGPAFYWGWRAGRGGKPFRISYHV
jgi:lipopolysaccharide/colanic/teichoic acid biosynthesis glycosyltransferase